MNLSFFATPELY
jgi:hypothetical protein